MYEVSDLNEILELPIPQMIDTIKKLPKGQKNLSRVSFTLIESHMLDSVHRIKALG